MCSTDSQSQPQKTQIWLTFLVFCLPNSSFKPRIPDLNLNKSLETMSGTQTSYSYIEIYFLQLSINSQLALFAHARRKNAYNYTWLIVTYSMYIWLILVRVSSVS